MPAALGLRVPNADSHEVTVICDKERSKRREQRTCFWLDWAGSARDTPNRGMLEIADKLTCNLSREPDLDIGERLPDPTLLRRLRIEASEAVRTPATRPDRIKMIYDTIG